MAWVDMRHLEYFWLECLLFFENYKKKWWGLLQKIADTYEYSHFEKKFLLLSEKICLNTFHNVKIIVISTNLGHAVGQLKF